MLRRVQLGGDAGEESLVGITARQQEADSACVAGDHRADLQEFQADRADIGVGPFRAIECQPADGLEQGIGEAREQEAKLVRPPGMTTGAIGKQIELLLLDAVLHLAACTVESVVKVLGFGLEVGHQVARVTALGSVLGLDDDAPATIPAPGGIKHDMETTLFAGGDPKVPLGGIVKRFRLGIQAVIACDTDEVVDVMVLTPAQHLPATEAGIGSQQDPHLRPGSAQVFDQQGEDRPGMFGRVDLARAQVADQ